MRKIILVVGMLLLGILSACSGEEENNIQKAIEVGKDYKEAVYTVDHDKVPEKLPERVKYLKEKTKAFLTADELERAIANRSIGYAEQAAEKREVDIAVKEMQFEYKEVPDNTETKINLSYTMTVELLDGEEVVEEFTFDGRMRVEKIDGKWLIDWDRDRVPMELLGNLGKQQ